jgi:hypothetical protein
MTTIRLTAAQAMVKWLSVQMTDEGERFIEGVWAIFGHGNVAGIGEALQGARDVLPTWRGHSAYGDCLCQGDGSQARDGGDHIYRAGGVECGDGCGLGLC